MGKTVDTPLGPNMDEESLTRIENIKTLAIVTSDMREEKRRSVSGTAEADRARARGAGKTMTGREGRTTRPRTPDGLRGRLLPNVPHHPRTPK